MRQAFAAAAVLAAMIAAAVPARAQSGPARPDGVARLLSRLETILRQGDKPAFLALNEGSDDPQRTAEFADVELAAVPTRVVVSERDRVPLDDAPAGAGFRILLDVFQEFGARARVATWEIDVRRDPADANADWTMTDEHRTSSIESLYNLSVNTKRQFRARDLTIAQEDLELVLSDGSVFAADTDQGVTALVLLGRGTIRFHPEPQTERGQVRIFCGADRFDAPFSVAFLRLNPADYRQLVAGDRLMEVPVDSREAARADRVFRDESPKSFGLDLAEFSPDPWALLPAPGDFLAEVRTSNYGTLTYSRSGAQAEDISFFDRARRKTIALYTSRQKSALPADPDAVRSDYTVRRYDIDVSMSPDRLWIEGVARIALTIRANSVNTLTFRLAEPLALKSIVSAELGRLFAIRVKRQGTVVVNLPATVLKDADLTLTISYSGRLSPQPAIAEMAGQQNPRDLPPDIDVGTPAIAAEPSFLYSAESDWYPKPPVNQFTTSVIHLNVPASFGAAATGEEVGAAVVSGDRATYTFRADLPVRYLAFVVTKLVRTAKVAVVSPQLSIGVDANPRQVSQAPEAAKDAEDIIRFYHSLVGTTPYPSLRIVLIESQLPGGHSPAYFTTVNQPLASSPFVWRNDPAAFDGYPEFFLAHEVAHQWWGQAVGWDTYHDQWLSEGFAQYFAALYAGHARGDDRFRSVMRQMRWWAVQDSGEGPVSLGYRLGHIRGDARVFRALVYNKAAYVLHMLRQVVGEEAFLRGLRQFFTSSQFRPARTADFESAMEAAAGRPLGRFFDLWIRGTALPSLRLTSHVEGAELVVHVEELNGVFEVPVPLVLRYANRTSETAVLDVATQTVDARIPLKGPLQRVDVDRDLTLAQVDVR